MLPDFIIGAAMHYTKNGECEAATLVHKESVGSAALNLHRWDTVVDMVTERTSSSISLSSVVFDDTPTPADMTFHLATACPFLR